MRGIWPLAVSCLLMTSATALQAQEKPALIKPIGDEIPVKFVADRMQFSPDGKTLCANTGGVIFLIDVATASIKAPGIQGPHGETGLDRPPEWAPVLAGSYSIALDSAFSPDSKKLLVVTSRTTQWWDVSKGRSLGRALRFGNHHNPTVVSGAGDVFLITRPSETIVPGRSVEQPMAGWLWNASRGKRSGKPLPFEVKVPAEEPHRRDFAQVAFSPDAKLLAAVHNNGRVRLFEWQKGKELIKEGLATEADDGSRTRVIWSPNSKRLLVYTDKEARLWDASTVTPIGDRLAVPGIPGADVDRRRRAAFSADSSKLALSSFNKDREERIHNVQLIDTETGTKVGDFSPGGIQGFRRIAHLEYVGDSLLVMAVDDPGNERRPWLWNPVSGKGIAEPPDVVRATHTAVSADGRYLATCGPGVRDASRSVVRLWELP